MSRGIILKKQADIFSVEFENDTVCDCVARKNLKKDGVFVGDNVEVDEAGAVSKVLERNNVLIRPPVANIDKMFIVVAPIPKPDLYTVDKMLLFCKVNGIDPVVCINKNDLDEKYCNQIANIYKNLVKTLVFSTLDDTYLQVKQALKGVCVLAGQSAVGKSSIINALKGDMVTKVDTFSKKVERGKQTTRTVQLFKFGKDKYLADTAGFSKLDERLLDLEAEEIKSYYPEFLKYAAECKYKSCLHLTDKDCGVCQALKAGKIDKTRYDNYKKLVATIKAIKKF